MSLAGACGPGQAVSGMKVARASRQARAELVACSQAACQVAWSCRWVLQPNQPIEYSSGTGVEGMT